MTTDTNLSEYLTPDLYDLENPDFEPEGSFYLSLAQELGGPVLELGCGTGRMTIPMAQAGIDITGLDIMPQMLQRAREKAGSLPITWVEADVRSFHLGRQFSLIFESGSVFMHMLERADQRAYLDRAREHLAPGGRLVLALFFPHRDGLEDVLEEKEWFSYQDEQGYTVRVSGTETYDELRQVKTETAIRRVYISDSEVITHVAPLPLRYTFPQEMDLLVECAGFRVLERYAGADRAPLTNTSRMMVYVLEKREA